MDGDIDRREVGEIVDDSRKIVTMAVFDSLRDENTTPSCIFSLQAPFNWLISGSMDA